MILVIVTPNLVTCTILMNHYCHFKQMPFAFSILANLFKRDCEPTTITMNTFLKSLYLNGNVHEAFQFHDQVVAHIFLLDYLSYGILLDGLCKAGQTTVVLQLMRFNKPDLVMYNTILSCLCKNKLINDALSLYYEMIDKKINLDAVTYNTLIHGFCIVGQLKKSYCFVP